MQIILQPPLLQTGFAALLANYHNYFLMGALRSAVADMDIRMLDKELYEYAPKEGLQRLASHGLRGELLFAVPYVLINHPRLIGYYRLLLGYSKKDFYANRANKGLGIFKNMEEKNSLSPKSAAALPDLCTALNASALYLLHHLEAKSISAALFNELSLITLGPQLRGENNNAIGKQGSMLVFGLLNQILGKQAANPYPASISLKNAAGKEVWLDFGSDPDIIIREKMAEAHWRLILAVEIKGGKDGANIHNRLGEAEKSHQKARASGYTEYWTVINVPGLSLEQVKTESPSTDRVYNLDEICDKDSDAHKDFSRRIRSLTGIS